MGFWCYILRCADGKYYTGHTDNLERRMGEHQTGEQSGFTSTRRPVELIWAQEFATRVEALESELRVKKWSRAKKEALAAGDLDKLSHYSKPPKERSTSSPPFDVSTTLDTNGGGVQ